MKDYRTITAQHMLEAYYGRNAEQRIWDTFETMHVLMFIPNETWEVFYKVARAWEPGQCGIPFNGVTGQYVKRHYRIQDWWPTPIVVK